MLNRRGWAAVDWPDLLVVGLDQASEVGRGSPLSARLGLRGDEVREGARSNSTFAVLVVQSLVAVEAAALAPMQHWASNLPSVRPLPPPRGHRA